MNRRDFLKLGTAAALVTPAAVAFAQSTSSASAPFSAAGDVDVLVYGSTPAGVAAAVSAARQGCRVILACPKNHPGGMLASGLCGLDSKRSDTHSGFVVEFVQRVRDVYQKRQMSNAPDWKQFKSGKGGHEPSVAEGVFATMIAGESAQLDYWKQFQITGATVNQGRVTEVKLKGPDGTERAVRARTFIDATYEGDLAGAAGVPYRVGRESAAEFGESLAGVRYLDFHTGEIIPTPDSGDPSPYIQAFCARCILTTDPGNLVPFVKPATYELHLPDLLPMLEDFAAGHMGGRGLGTPLPAMKFEANGAIDEWTSLDCPGMNLDWPEASIAHRANLEKFHLDHAASYFWFLQNEPQVPDHIRQIWAPAGLPQDEFADSGHLPWQIYVRQGRRIEGRARVTQANFMPDAKTGRSPVVEHPIAVGEYPFDIHACKDRRFTSAKMMEGVIWYPDKVPRPCVAGQIPYASMLPKNVDNLLVPVGLSATHIGFSVVRMEPVWMATGQAAGLAAGEAKKHNLDVSQIDPTPLPELGKTKIDPWS
jgi:hypothetical protein